MEEFKGLKVPPMSPENVATFCADVSVQSQRNGCNPAWSGSCLHLDCDDCVFSKSNSNTRREFQNTLLSEHGLDRATTHNESKEATPIKYSFDRPLSGDDINTGVLFVYFTDTEKKHTKTIVLKTGSVKAISKDGMKAKIKVYGSSAEPEVVSATDVLKTAEDIVDKLHVLTESFGEEFTPHIFSVDLGSVIGGETMIKVHEYFEDDFSDYYYYIKDDKTEQFSFNKLPWDTYVKISDFLQQLTSHYNAYLYDLYSMKYYKWATCPSCGSDDVDWAAFDSDITSGGDGFVTENVKCNACGCEWEEIYKTTPSERKITNGRSSKK